jgi:hypothetical protein
MPQLTIDFPESVMPWLARQAENENTTPERYLISHVLYSMAQEEDKPTYSDPAQKRLEEILVERDKGPFIEITRDYDLKGRVMARVKARLEQASAHA